MNRYFYAGLALVAVWLVAAFAMAADGDVTEIGTTYHMTGGDNVAVGIHALENATTGSGNIALGAGACRSVTTGNCNICIGDGIDVPNGAMSGYVNINGAVYSDPQNAGVLRSGVIETLKDALKSVGRDMHTNPSPICKSGRRDGKEK